MPHRGDPRPWFALLLLLLSLGGCGLFGGAKNPKIQVAGATLTGLDLTLKPIGVNLRLELLLRVDNPNDFDLKVRAVRGQVTLAGRQTLPVQLSPDTWLPAGQTTELTVPAQLPVETALTLAREVISSDCIPYSFEGSADITATSTFKLDQDDHPFKKEGCIPRKSLLKVLDKR